jgi:orotate phosphoribosyltransferase
LLSTKDGQNVNNWQFYLPIALLDGAFSEKVGALFWERFATDVAFQVAGCESAGVLLALSLQQHAPTPTSVIEVKKKPKSYGLGNILEGIVDSTLDVVLVDDLIGKGTTLRRAIKVLRDAGLKVRFAFAVAAVQNWSPDTIDGIPCHTLYRARDFARTWGAYVAKYGRRPQFAGSLR